MRVPGGAPLAWVWGVRGRALSHPRLSALLAGCWGPLPTGCGCGGVQAWGPVTNPTARALASRPCALWGRHEGARGGASCLGVEHPGPGALPTPTARPLGGLPGPTTHWLWVRGGAGVGTRHQPHRARFCELALRPVGAARGRPGGAPPAWAWGVRGRALSRPSLPTLWAGCRGPLPTGCGFGGVQAWGLVTNPTARALASWLCALLWRHEVARGGAPLAWVWGVRGRALSGPRLPALWAGCRGPLRTSCGCGGVRAWGPVTNPTARALASWLCALWGRHEGARGHVSCPGVGRPGLGAPPPSTARPLGGLLGPTVHWLWVLGGAGVGTRHQPHSARFCELALRAVGAARGRPGGALPAWPPGVRRPALSHLQLPALWAGCRGPLPTGCGCGGVRGWGPVTNPTARALASWLCALWGRHEGARGGASCVGVWRPGSGALPPPTTRPLGGLPGPTTRWLWVRGGAGVRTCHQPHSARFCELALHAVGAARGRPGGGASCLGLGRPGSGALPPETARPLGGLPGPTTHWLWVRGGAGVGTCHQPHSARSCELAWRAVGAA